jgi:hypothetical protein
LKIGYEKITTIEPKITYIISMKVTLDALQSNDGHHIKTPNPGITEVNPG